MHESPLYTQCSSADQTKHISIHGCASFYSILQYGVKWLWKRWNDCPWSKEIFSLCYLWGFFYNG